MKAERIEEILELLPQLVVDLDSDPTSRGPAYLQDLIYQVRNKLNTTSIYIQEVLRWKSSLESDLEALEVAFQVDADELLTNESRVTRLPAVQDRQAMINVILRDQRKAILEKRKEVNDAGHLDKAIRHRHRELEQTMSAIRLQRTLIETERRTGSFYGDESEVSRGNGTWGRNPPKEEDIDEEELANLMDQIGEGEVVEETPTTEKVEDGEVSDLLDIFDNDVSLEVVEPQVEDAGLQAEAAVVETDLPEVEDGEDPAIERFLDDDPSDEDDFSDIFERLDTEV